MMCLQNAIKYAKQMRELHGEPWLVFITPASAPCNHPGYDLYNEGRFMTCAASERAEYEAGGARFPGLPASSGIPEQVAPRPV